jgi:hypothetical protein
MTCSHQKHATGLSRYEGRWVSVVRRAREAGPSRRETLLPVFERWRRRVDLNYRITVLQTVPFVS